jgi:hypothetical protein
MKQKNLVLMTGLALVLVMTFSVISAGWFTGKAVDWSTKIYKGNTRAIPGTDDKITIVSASDNSAIVDINGNAKEITEGQTRVIGKYSVYVVDAGKTLFSYWAKVEVKEIEGTSETTEPTEEPASEEVTYAGVLKMLNSCETIATYGSSDEGESGKDCNTLCKELSTNKGVCIGTIFTVGENINSTQEGLAMFSGRQISRVSFKGCDETTIGTFGKPYRSISVECMCCSLP